MYPKVFFHKSPTFWICRKCHDKLEKIIYKRTKRSKKDYLKLTINFLKGEKND